MNENMNTKAALTNKQQSNSRSGLEHLRPSRATHGVRQRASQYRALGKMWGAALAICAGGALGLSADMNSPGADLAHLGYGRSGSSERFSGALAGLRPPTYDGPIRWEDMRFGVHINPTTSECALVFGLICGLVGAVFVGVKGWSTEDVDPLLKKMARTGMSCGGVGALLVVGGCKTSGYRPGKNVEFSTVVTQVLSIDDSARAYPAGMKHSDRSYIYYQQVVAVPESTLPLCVKRINAPFHTGQRIVAKLKVGADGNIISWWADVGTRAE